MALFTTIDRVGQLTVLSVLGDVDLSTVPTLHHALGELIGDRRGQVVAVDLDGIESFDDVGLGILLGAAGRARGHDGDVVLLCAGARLRERLARTGLDRAMVVHPSASAAAQSIDRL